MKLWKRKVENSWSRLYLEHTKSGSALDMFQTGIYVKAYPANGSENLLVLSYPLLDLSKTYCTGAKYMTKI